jgi:hypothetical protein
MTSNEVNATLRRLARTYVTDLVRLPNASQEGAASHALHINDTGVGVLLLAGVHPNETVTPAILLTFAERLCEAIRGGTGITFGPVSYTKDDVKTIISALNILVLPLANPDGADWQEQVTVPWRKNRALNWDSGCREGYDCHGVDINRNFDFLWRCGFNASPDAWSAKYKGPGAGSEPETRNIVWLLDEDDFQISFLLDVHARDRADAGLVLYPWGDAKNQSTDPKQSFTKKPKCEVVSGGKYGEYISLADHAWFKKTAKTVAEACSGYVKYTPQQSYYLYPTTGTVCDYAYSRHIAKASKRPVLPILIESASPFFPTQDEATRAIDEVSAGIFAFLLQCAKDAARGSQAGAGDRARQKKPTRGRARS